MLRLEGQPFCAIDAVWATGAMIQLYAFGYGCNEDGHAIVVQRGAELSHGAVYGVEYMIGVP